MITENGWPSCRQDQLDFSNIPGTNESVGLQRGQPNTVLKAFMGALNKYVEAAVDSRGGGQDEGGWTATNSVPTSNHLGGTAFDYNWRDHPMGPKVPDLAAGWQWSEIVGGPEEGRVRELLRYCTFEGLQMVWWANDWNSPHDSMHFQMGYGTFGDERVQRFIDQCIDPATGMLRFFEDKGNPNVDVPATLAEVMGNTHGVNYHDMAPLFAMFCHEADCTTVERIAMAAAQIGEESGGLLWMEELASGAEYEGRVEGLGNTQPGDGVRFKGRGPIQLTGRNNYTLFSKWAYARELCDTPTYFVDHPEAVSEYENGFLAAAYFWTQHSVNVAADAKDVVRATKIINGGDHGLQDRQFRYNRAMLMGQRLLALIGDDELSGVDVDRLNKAVDKILGGGTMPGRWASRSMFARDGVGVDDTIGMELFTDGNAFNAVVILAALAGVPSYVDDVQRVAAEGPAEGTFAAEHFADEAQEFAQALAPLCGLLPQLLPAKSKAKRSKRTEE